jgi:hypothetical protein
VFIINRLLKIDIRGEVGREKAWISNMLRVIVVVEKRLKQSGYKPEERA